MKRNRDKWAALSSDHLKVALSHLTYNVVFLKEDDDTITATLKQFDIVENGDTQEEALDLIVDALVEYANEYQENFNLHFNSPNRRDEFPYIINVLAQKDIDQVKGLVKCQVGEK